MSTWPPDLTLHTDNRCLENSLIWATVHLVMCLWNKLFKTIYCQSSRKQEENIITVQGLTCCISCYLICDSTGPFRQHINLRLGPTALERLSGIQMHLLPDMSTLRVTSPPRSRQSDVICCDLKAKQRSSQTFERGTAPLPASIPLESVCACRAAMLFLTLRGFSDKPVTQPGGW